MHDVIIDELDPETDAINGPGDEYNNQTVNMEYTPAPVLDGTTGDSDSKLRIRKDLFRRLGRKINTPPPKSKHIPCHLYLSLHKYLKYVRCIKKEAKNTKKID